jgi:hypothetical protein
MAQPSGKAKEISLGDDFGDVTVKANGTAVDIHADGSIEHYPILKCIRRQRLANDDSKVAASAEPKVGDKMPDGTVFAGISPDANKPMYATPADTSLTMTFNDAQKYAAQLDAHGHKDWHLPSKAELNVLFNNRAAIGGFDISGSIPAGWYWSASPLGEWDAWCQRLSDGAQDGGNKNGHLSVRPVR